MKIVDRGVMTRLATCALLLGLSLLAAALPVASQTKGPEVYGGIGLCGRLDNHLGPFDYRKPPLEHLRSVERFHFTRAVESLTGGASGRIGNDLNYTLHVFPNHHRALSSMTRLYERAKGERPQGMQYPGECYFDRAIRFTPDDALVRILYGFYLLKGKRESEARDQFLAAEKHGANDAQTQYNLGLAYLELKEFDRSRAFAEQAYAGGITMPGLRDRLKRVGAWH